VNLSRLKIDPLLVSDAAAEELAIYSFFPKANLDGDMVDSDDDKIVLVHH